MMQTILSGTLASSGYSYVLQMSALQGGKYEVVVGDKGKPMFCRQFEPTKSGYVEGRKWLHMLQDMGPFEIARLAEPSPHESQAAAFG
jgi:hypothetical protein